MPVGPGQGYEELVSGSFAAVDVLGPETDFPIILTTSKGPDCSFLEMRGKFVKLEPIKAWPVFT